MINGSTMSWDGVQKSSTFSHELELSILPRSNTVIPDGWIYSLSNALLRNLFLFVGVGWIEFIFLNFWLIWALLEDVYFILIYFFISNLRF